MNLTCANQNCSAELKYLRGGRLYLLEREPHVPAQSAVDPCQPSPHVTMRRYFWLCEACSQKFVLRRWTAVGVELIPRHGPARVTARSQAIGTRDWVVPGLVG